MNVDGEESKHGFTPEGLQELWPQLVVSAASERAEAVEGEEKEPTPEAE